MKSVAVDPGDGNVVYAGAADGGVWRPSTQVRAGGR